MFSLALDISVLLSTHNMLMRRLVSLTDEHGILRTEAHAIHERCLAQVLLDQDLMDPFFAGDDHCIRC